MNTPINQRVRTRPLLSTSSLCLAIATLAQAGLLAGIVIGGFDAARGGFLSFDGGGVNGARSSLQTAFPGAAIATANQLTPAFLSGVNVVILGSGTDNTTAITPLSVTEQDALKNFVLGGGGAVLFVDNDTFDGTAGQTANTSLVSPFGLGITGTLNGAQGVTMTTPGADPISGGPFGTVASITYYWPGWFDTQPAGAVEVATLNDNNGAALCYFPKGSLGTFSGGVVCFSDGTLMADAYASSSAYTLLDNAVAYVVPEPGNCAVFAGIGLLALALWRRSMLL